MIFKYIINAIIPTVHARDIEWNPGDQSIWSRLKRATSLDKYGNLSKETASVLSVTQNSLIFGTFAGVSIWSKNAFMDFMENNRASQFTSHLDAKDALNNRMYQSMTIGTINWTWRCVVVSLTFSVLVNFIPVIRNKVDWKEYVASGVISGTLAGYLFSDRKSLGFVIKKQTGRLPYRQLCILRGFSYGLLIGTAFGAWTYLSNAGEIESQLRQWEDYWKQRKTIQNSNADVNNKSESK